ncbi:MAG: hypothetical protein HY273_03105 [Gammaproteobacteria bacterium]|nr:hypothetical protein [Gammaproteobacteria bacterium]
MTTSKKNKTRISLAKQHAPIEHISIGGLTARMGPLALHHYASAFLDAARELPPAAVSFEPVRPFLVCHSIELALKAFLSLHGATMLDLSDASYGHKLDKILQAADEKGLGNLVSLTDEYRIVIRQASIYYEGKVFEYPAVGEALSAYPNMPALDDLLDAASILVNSLRQRCLEAE